MLVGLCYNVRTMPQRIFRLVIFIFCAALCGAATQGRTHPAQSSAAPRATSASESRAETILIFPFQNDSRMASLDWLGEGLSELTAERFEDRGVNVLSREDRLATLEKMGLPDSARFSHATIVKIATEADADAVIFGRFQYDGQKATLEARVLRISSPSLSPAFSETGSMQDLLRVHARLTWKMLCAMNKKQCPFAGRESGRIQFFRTASVFAPGCSGKFHSRSYRIAG